MVHKLRKSAIQVQHQEIPMKSSVQRAKLILKHRSPNGSNLTWKTSRFQTAVQAQHQRLPKKSTVERMVSVSKSQVNKNPAPISLPVHRQQKNLKKSSRKDYTSALHRVEMAMRHLHKKLLPKSPTVQTRQKVGRKHGSQEFFIIR